MCIRDSLLVCGKQATRSGQGGIQHQATEVRKGHILGPLCQLDIAEAVKGEGGPHGLWLPVGYIMVFAKGGAHVIPVKITILQYLAELQVEFAALRRPAGKLQPAHHVLPHIQHGFPGGGVDNGHWGEMCIRDRAMTS